MCEAFLHSKMLTLLDSTSITKQDIISMRLILKTSRFIRLELQITNIQRNEHISSFITFNLIEIMDRSTRYPLDSPLYLDNIYRRAAISIAIPFLISSKLTNSARNPLSPINIIQNNLTKMFGYSSRATEHQMQTQ